MTAYRPITLGGCVAARVDRRADGSTLLWSAEPLADHAARLTDRLEHWAGLAPGRSLVAMRDAQGAWRAVTYAEMLVRVRRIGQALALRGLGPERPVVVLSDNDIEHFTLMLAAQWVGVPVTSVSTAYSLLSQDFGKLRQVLATVQPGLVFAADARYAPALQAAVPSDVDVVLSAPAGVHRRQLTPFEALLEQDPGDAEAAMHAATGPDTIAKFLFTSGSTKAPKAVINTQRMLCSNQQMVLQCHPFLADEPPVLVDWLPWSHTFGGNHNTGLVVWNGGTLYIDEGRPTPGGMAATLRNLREVSPTLYYNVPKGFEALVDAMDTDPVLRDTLFRRLRVLKYAGAGLSPAVWSRLDAHAEASIGMRVCMSTGLGMTETAPSSLCAVGPQVRGAHVGLPCPGVEARLVPVGDKTEIRFRGPNVTPGYWRAPDLTRAAFDDEGYLRTGDAVAWVDPADPQQGLRFDGRIAEDFKLDTGTFVSVGPLRARAVALGAPLLQDVVVTGLNRGEVGMLFVPHLPACRRLAGLPDAAPAAEVLAHDAVQAAFAQLLQRLHDAGTGSATCVRRALLLSDALSLDRGEVTDKGSVNQRAVLTHRAALVDAMYDGSAPALLLAGRRA